jgi:lysozyme family protein
MFPTASPNHHISHTAGNCSHATMPAVQSVPTPTVALAVVLSRAAHSKKFRTSRIRGKEIWKSVKRVRKRAPRNASSVFPADVAKQTHNGTGLARGVKNAPNATPGKSRYPPSNTAARESPVGIQMSVAIS